MAAAHRHGVRRERGGDRKGLGRDPLAPGLSQGKRRAHLPQAGARRTGSRRPGGRTRSRAGAPASRRRHCRRTAAPGEPEWETKPIRARRGAPRGASVARRQLMALRHKTAYEDWATRYRAGKRAPKETATTISGMPVEPLYTPQDLAGWRYDEKLGYPGEFPYTRGVYPSMYRGQLWTIRQFAGYGTAEETNRRYKFLLSHGQAGLSVAFDMPTLMGYDSDDPLSEGEVGHCGVAIDSLEDMETLFSGIRLDQITTSMTINSPAAILYAMYIAVGEKEGLPQKSLGGTLQNDILKEYIAQKEYIFPPEPSMRLVVDTIVFAARNMPRWNPVSISGYHIREAGSTAVQELAFTLADGMAYVEASVRAGLSVDEFAPRLSFFFDSHIDFFEEIAKFRAARRLWARIMRDKYGARDPRSWMLRFHTQTAGVSLTRQQAENNISRTAYEAMAAVLGGTNSLHTNSMDEVLALPTEQGAQGSPRQHQRVQPAGRAQSRGPGQ